MLKKPAIVVFLAVLLTSGVSAQEARIDLNQYYKFPVGIGFEYQGLTPFSAFSVPYSIFDLAGSVTIPIPKLPMLQPFGRVGYARFNSLDTLLPGKWDLYQVYASLGMAYATRLSKNFEVGGDLSVGLAEAVFPNAVDTGPVGSPYLLLGLGGKVSLTPSYGFSIDFHPSLRYQLGLTPYTALNGFLLSLGVSAGFRFGEDPDSAKAVIRSLRFEKGEIKPAFSAMQSYYARNPIGTVTIVNTEKLPLTDVEISFNQKEYMDAPSPSYTAARMEPGASAAIPLKAVFNGKVFDLEGGATPLTGEVVATYKLGGRAAEQRYPISYELWDKTAMTWDDDKKAAAFITPLDSALKNYTAFVSESGKQASLPGWNPALQAATMIYDALREINIYYQEDPASPFTKVQSNPQIVDFITMPRLTLKRRYGDCKNLTVLFCSLLETKNISSGFITVPGHIYPVFDTGIPVTDYRDLNPDQTMTLPIGDTLWVPVEVTMLDGKSDFLAAWTRAIEEWKQYKTERMFYSTRDAQAVYSPVAVQQTDLGLQYGNPDNIAKLFQQDLDEMAGVVIKGYAAAADAGKDKKGYNKLGTMAARLGKLKDAEDAFSKALKLDSKYMAAMVNLGNVAFLRADYKKASDAYRSVLPLLGKPTKGTQNADVMVIVLVNLSRTYTALGNTAQSKSSLAQASSIDADKTERLAQASTGAAGGTRAASSAAEPTVAFVEEQE